MLHICFPRIPAPTQNHCTPEIKTSEIIVDFQWHFPMDVQWCFPTNKSLVSGIFQRIVTFPVDNYWKFPMDFQWRFPMELHFCDFWCVIFCPERQISRMRPTCKARPPWGEICRVLHRPVVVASREGPEAPRVPRFYLSPGTFPKMLECIEKNA